MPINVSSFIFQETDYTDYSGARTQWTISGSALNPSDIDVLKRFQDVYPQYEGNMFDAYDYAEGDGVVRYNDGYGYTYWRLVAGNLPISDIIFNGTPLMEFKQGAVVVFKKAIGTFGGLSGASPSSYPSQIVRADLNEQVVNPGSPSKSGYTFAGWSPSLPRTIAANTVFTAQWSQAGPTTWTYLGTTAVSPTTFNAYFQEAKCPSSIIVRAWLDANHPASNYSMGHIVSVTVYNGFPPSLCTRMRFQAT